MWNEAGHPPVYTEASGQKVSQQTQNVESMLVQHWSNVVDGGPP